MGALLQFCGLVAFAVGALAAVYQTGKLRGRKDLAHEIKTSQQASSLLFAARDAATPFNPGRN